MVNFPLQKLSVNVIKNQSFVYQSILLIFRKTKSERKENFINILFLYFQLIVSLSIYKENLTER